MAHGFHRYAHHPLCDRYAAEVFRVGPRTRLCLGCALAASGLLVGFAAGLLAPASLHSLARSSLGVLAALVMAVAGRRFHPSGLAAQRLNKLFARGVAGMLLGFVAAAPAGFVLSVVSAATLLIAYRRQGPRRTPCESCPERTRRVCSGMVVQVRRERAFRRLSGRWLSHPTDQA